MERGVALRHSFGYTEAQRQFEAIVKDDSGCAMAHWGVAMTQYQELWSRPDAAALKVGAAEMAKARSIAAAGKITSREKGYSEALSAFFDPADAWGSAADGAQAGGGASGVQGGFEAESEPAERIVERRQGGGAGRDEG
jgi:hypothetical protein